MEAIFNIINHYFFLFPLIFAIFAYFLASRLKNSPHREPILAFFTPSDKIYNRLTNLNYALLILFYIAKRLSERVYAPNALVILAPAAMEILIYHCWLLYLGLSSLRRLYVSQADKIFGISETALQCVWRMFIYSVMSGLIFFASPDTPLNITTCPNDPFLPIGYACLILLAKAWTVGYFFPVGLAILFAGYMEKDIHLGRYIFYGWICTILGAVGFAVGVCYLLIGTVASFPGS
ncbi:MAG: hypothetical protein PHW04_17700 [Candidatus Wallbacteria bacterium]|nr:hypothetical protein [Candidatus Wallbacteria bacterium]